ncbi:M24 family metallopeptidase C-terminal domain-containing protein [Burkholderia gladioli]|nr:M24 family metallopeptidase C-terminal domain-containing protein [Burkholderia gladioli]
MNRAAAQTPFGDFLEFETLTLCPIDTRCVQLELLDAKRFGGAAPGLACASGRAVCSKPSGT